MLPRSTKPARKVIGTTLGVAADPTRARRVIPVDEDNAECQQRHDAVEHCRNHSLGNKAADRLKCLNNNQSRAECVRCCSAVRTGIAKVVVVRGVSQRPIPLPSENAPLTVGDYTRASCG